MERQTRFSIRPIFITSLIAVVAIGFWYLNNYQGVLSHTVTTSDFVLFITFIAIVATTIETASMRRVNQALLAETASTRLLNQAMLAQQQKEEVFKFRPYLYTNQFQPVFDRDKQMLVLNVAVHNAGGTPARHVAFTAGLGSGHQMIWKIIFDEKQHDYLVQGHSKTSLIRISKKRVEEAMELIDQGDGEALFTLRWHYSDYNGNRYTYRHSYKIERREDEYDLRHTHEDDLNYEEPWPALWLEDQVREWHLGGRESSYCYIPPKYPVAPNPPSASADNSVNLPPSPV